jgi:uncharacterized protein (DUF1697 family)
MVGTRYLCSLSQVGHETLQGYGALYQGTTRDRLGGMRVAALLRGVNLGKRQVKMADLRAAVEALGHTDVETYLQSGNVVYTPARSPGAELAAGLSAALGFRIEVVLRTGKELAKVVAANPYPVDDPTKVVVTFLAERRPKNALAAVDQTAFTPDEFTFTGRELYLKLPHGQARSKLMEALAKQELGTTTTTRNWRTVTALADLTA